MVSPNNSVTDTLSAFPNRTSVLNEGSCCPNSSRVRNVRDRPAVTARSQLLKLFTETLNSAHGTSKRMSLHISAKESPRRSIRFPRA